MAEARTAEERAARRRTVRKRPHTQHKNNSIDIPLVIVMAGLMIFGLLMIFSTSAYNAGEDQASFLRMQLVAEGLGVIAILIIVLFPASIPKWLG
ncbi:MAG: hypothetical protein IKN07_01085, partial [Lachnospiraceae bacterium]|nr:hypothetical protein [Lachnospiraceae bacterium]